MFFSDAEITSYYEALKYTVKLVWTGNITTTTLPDPLPPGYKTRQNATHQGQTSIRMNLDVLNTVLLSLHPEGVTELQPFKALLLLEGHTGTRRTEPEYYEDLVFYLANLPDNYTAQVALMGWFLTLTSKMTGYRISGLGVAPCGQIQQDREAVDAYLRKMETLAAAMAVEKNWNQHQVKLLVSWTSMIILFPSTPSSRRCMWTLRTCTTASGRTGQITLLCAC